MFEVSVLAVAGYAITGLVSMWYFDHVSDRADYPEPGKYELTRFFIGVLWPLWPVRWFVAWRRRSEQERPPG